MSAPRIPPIHCLQAFETLARLRSVTLAAEELHVTPSAVSHRIRQLETQIDLKLFERADFGLTHEGTIYLARVREALTALQRVPGSVRLGGTTRLRVAVTPTFSRQLLLPKLALFRHLYPDIELILQVTIPVMNLTAEEADIEVRFGVGPFADREAAVLLSDQVSPVCWLDSGRLVRVSQRSVTSPHHYYVCWKPGALDRWECAAFVDWLKAAMC